MIYILIGPSGSGKTAIGKSSGLPELISHTSRNIRQGEINGETYYFVTKDNIKEMDKVEFTEYNGELYSLSKKEIEKKTTKYSAVFVIMDKKGVEQMKKIYGNNIKVIYIIAPFFQIYKRLIKRDGFLKATKRIWYALKTKEFKNHDIANYTIRNNDGMLENSITLFKEIVKIRILSKKIKLLKKA
jgi:guanylate kinase